MNCSYSQNFRTLTTIPSSVRRLFARLSGRPSGRPAGCSPARPSVHPPDRQPARPVVCSSSHLPRISVRRSPRSAARPILRAHGSRPPRPSRYNQVLGDRPLGHDKANYRHNCLLDCRCRHHVTKRGLSIYTGGASLQFFSHIALTVLTDNYRVCYRFPSGFLPCCAYLTLCPLYI